MATQLPGGVSPADAIQRMVPVASGRPGRRLIVAMLLVAAVLDLIRCGVVLATAQHAGLTIGLVTVGLAAAALSLGTAYACQSSRPWSAWAALLIGTASAPQAALSGFRVPFTIPDTATATLGVLLSVAVLATAGQTGLRGGCRGPGHQRAGGSLDHPQRR